MRSSEPSSFLEPRHSNRRFSGKYSHRCSRSSSAPSANLRSLEEIEKEVIAATLEATHYKIGRASEILGISRKTLLEKRKKYELK